MHQTLVKRSDLSHDFLIFPDLKNQNKRTFAKNRPFTKPSFCGENPRGNTIRGNKPESLSEGLWKDPLKASEKSLKTSENL